MNIGLSSRHLAISAIALLFSFIPVNTAQAQEDGSFPASAGSAATIAQPVTYVGEPRALYGLQGVLVETLSGTAVAEQAIDTPFNPASGIKVATALVALRTFGPEHRFTTGVWANGILDSGTGTLHGDLYISGRDPSFHYEHAIMIAKQLNSLGIRAVNGNLTVAPGFTMNFAWSARQSGEQLYNSFDSALRSAAATRAWLDDRFLVGDHESRNVVPSLAVLGEVKVGTVAPGTRLLLTHKSSKLPDILKVLLCYSNNFMAERIGDTLGGTQSVQQQLIVHLGLDPNELKLASLSGLGVNRVTPRAMMKILRTLVDELKKHQLSLSDIMPVAGIDPGTLKDRFKTAPWQGSVIAKTGTLIRTDQGASSLVGQMKAATGETLLFVILNQKGNVVRFRENQDYLVRQIQSSRGGPKAFEYKPKSLTLRLADRQSVLASAAEEFEPTNLAETTP